MLLSSYGMMTAGDRPRLHRKVTGELHVTIYIYIYQPLFDVIGSLKCIYHIYSNIVNAAVFHLNPSFTNLDIGKSYAF